MNYAEIRKIDVSKYVEKKAAGEKDIGLEPEALE